MTRASNERKPMTPRRLSFMGAKAIQQLGDADVQDISNFTQQDYDWLDRILRPDQKAALNNLMKW